MGKPKIIIISGPTASGKSMLAIELALALHEAGMAPEVISADSAQVYRYMDIGTDKLKKDERKSVAHHLIDIVNPDEHCDAAIFRTLALKKIEEMRMEKITPILVGGTGFWIRALLYGLFSGPGRDEEIRAELKKLARAKGSNYLHHLLSELDPESAARIHPNDLNRLIRSLEVQRLTGRSLSEHFKKQKKEKNVDCLHIALNVDRHLLHQRINERVDKMMKKDFPGEVERLRQMGYGPGLESQKIIGYRQLHDFLDGRMDMERSVHEIKKQTRHYARRQLVWLRGQPEIVWLDPRIALSKLLDASLKFVQIK